jgi:hypothetical protein
MGNFFEGFLKGFSTTGAEMLKEQDAAQQRINEITKKGEIDLNNTLKQLRETAKLEIEAKEAARAAAYARVNGVSPEALKTPILQTQEAPTEEVIDEQGNVLMPGAGVSDAQPAATPVTVARPSTPDITANQYINENLAVYDDPEKAIEKGMDEYRALQREGRKEEIAISKEERKNKDTAWRDALKNKDSDIFAAVKASGSYEKNLSTLQAAKKANEKLNVGTFSYKRLPGVTLTKEAQALNIQKVEGALSKVQETVGAISNAEMDLFGQASVNPSNLKSTNESLLNLRIVQTIRTKQFADFMNKAQLAGLSVEEARDRWGTYIENTPVFSSEDGVTINLNTTVDALKKDKTYLAYLKGSPAAAPTDTTTPGTQSTGLTFEDLLNSAEAQ